MARTAEQAADWARAQLGNYGWDNLCLSFVRQSFGIDYVGDWPNASRNAGTAWDRAKLKVHETDPSKIPFGVPVFFELATMADHVGFSTDDGDMIANDFVRDGRIDYNKIADVSRSWGPLLGWTKDLVGNTIWTPPKPVIESPETARFRLAQISMQFDDNRSQKAQDASKIFRRARRRGISVVAGTEASENDLEAALRKSARDNGFIFHLARGEWIAVDRDLVVQGTEVKTGFELAIESHEGQGKHSDRGVAWIKIHTKRFGRMTFGSGHMLTDGRKKGQPNFVHNEKMAAVIEDWGARHGADNDLVFYLGDQNSNDRDSDTFRGGKFTSFADALKDWQNTGHGPIDVIAFWKGDKRVTPVDFRVLEDGEFMLHTDHFFCVGVADIKVLDR